VRRPSAFASFCFNLSDIESIRRLIAANPEASRWALSRQLCEAWNWKQANGALRDMVCRGPLLMLERAGEIARRRNIHLLAYNTRFLILPWVTVPHLASHILGRMARQVPGEWQRLYAHPVYLLETFVDPERFRGTCYRAANWAVVGRTTGRGKNDLTHKPNRSIKEVLALPVHRRFRELLSF
jgi:Domain of unknown function (DUF4338)